MKKILSIIACILIAVPLYAGTTTNLGWDYGTRGQSPWWDIWTGVLQSIDTDLYSRTNIVSATVTVAASNSIKKNTNYVCTGVNDQNVINTAINAASPGGRVVLLEGTYYINNVTAQQYGVYLSDTNNNFNVTLEGQGMGTVLKIPNGNNIVMAVIRLAGNSVPLTGVRIKNLRIDGNRSNVTGTFYEGIAFENVGSINGKVLIEGVHLSNGKGTGSDGYGYWFNNSSYIDFINCFGGDWNFEPVEIRASHHIKFSACTFQYRIELYDTTDDIDFDNCTFIDMMIAMGTDTGGGVYCDRIRVSNSRFITNNDLYGLGHNAISLSKTRQAQIVGNTLHLNGANVFGVGGIDATEALIANNIFYMTYSGVGAIGSAGFTRASIIGNKFYSVGVSTYGIAIQGAYSYNLIADNTSYNSDPSNYSSNLLTLQGSSYNFVYNNTCNGAGNCIDTDATSHNNTFVGNHFLGNMNRAFSIAGNDNVLRANDYRATNYFFGRITNTGTGNLLDQGSTGELNRIVAEATGTPAGTTTNFVITLGIPTGSRLLGCQLRVDTALTTGETWKADYSGGSTTSIAAGGQAVAKDTKVNKMHVDEITTNTTNVTITRDAGNFTNGVGVIRAIVYYEAFAAMANAP